MTPRAALEKFAAVQMIDVHLPTMDGRELALDSKLRGCDLVRLQINDVCVGGRVRDRATVIQL